MAGIQRFITYIYAYEEGKKGANKGFAKVEIRGNDCRMEIHIRDIRRGCQTGEIFLFREKDGKMESISVGEMKLLDGRGDYGFVFKTEKIKNTMCAFRDIEGVLITIEDESICLSRWTEGKPIDVRFENVILLSDEKPTTTRQTAEPEHKPFPVRSEQQSQAFEAKQPATAQAAVSQTAEPEHKPTQAEQQSQAFEAKQPTMAQPTTSQITEPESKPTPTPVQPATSQSAEPTSSQPAAPQTAMRQESMDASEWQENIQATEIPMRNIFPQYQWLEVWEELQRSHPSLILHQEKEIPCVRIELKDLRELPQKYWCFGNNSFLLHGFFNYRYLIVGRLEVDRWFIGVPGVYQPQERVMAAIFGFTEFLPEDKPVEKKENKFGYWYHVF